MKFRMKNITIAICALMLNSAYALNLPKPALEKSAKVDLVVEIPKTALEELEATNRWQH